MFPLIVCGILGCILLLKIFLIVTTGKFESTNVCLSGKTALITGGSTGIGYEISMYLASRGCRVIIADIRKANQAIENITKVTGNSQVVYIYLDLSSFSSVRKFCTLLLSMESRLDIVINNAGCGGYKCKTEDEIYKVLQVNHLGHFLLTHLLAPLLINTLNSRVVFVCSLMAFINTLSIGKDINCEEKWPLPIMSEVFDYGNSKACMLATIEIFSKKFSKEGVLVTSCHPGLVKTRLVKRALNNFSDHNSFLIYCLNIVGYLVLNLFGKTRKQGIQSPLHCALSNNVKSADFIVDCHRFIKPLFIYNSKFCTHIWEESIRLTNIQTNELLI